MEHPLRHQTTIPKFSSLPRRGRLQMEAHWRSPRSLLYEA